MGRGGTAGRTAGGTACGTAAANVPREVWGGNKGTANYFLRPPQYSLSCAGHRSRGWAPAPIQ